MRQHLLLRHFQRLEKPQQTPQQKGKTEPGMQARTNPVGTPQSYNALVQLVIPRNRTTWLDYEWLRECGAEHQSD
jgi:hypothetical protein